MAKRKTTRRKRTGRPRTRAAARPDRMRILSIDGGGIRGIIPGQILVHVEQLLQQRTGNQDARIVDTFDLIAGTSTGGILACLYLTPAGATGILRHKPRFTAKQAVELYLEHGDEVFEVSLLHKIRTAGGLTDEKYPAAGLEELLEDFLDDLWLSQLIKPCLITSYDIKRRRTFFFTQHDAAEDPGSDFLVRHVARATSAAPTYFEAARVKSRSHIRYPLIDGGVFANNPALCAYAEARKFPKKPTAKDMFVLTLGTGNVKKPYEYSVAKDWGLVEWVKPVLDIMMTGVAETVHYQLQMIFDSVGKKEQYLRINPDLYNADPAMDNVEQENLAALREAGDYAFEKNQEDLEKFIDLLI